MRTILRLSGCVCLVTAAGCMWYWFLGRRSLLLPASAWFLAGIVLLTLSAILDRLTYIAFFLKSAQDTGGERFRESAQGMGAARFKTSLGDFEKLGNVEGQAMCLGCRETVPKADLYYHKKMDVYYHAECLARDQVN